MRVLAPYCDKCNARLVMLIFKSVLVEDLARDTIIIIDVCYYLVRIRKIVYYIDCNGLMVCSFTNIFQQIYLFVYISMILCLDIIPQQYLEISVYLFGVDFLLYCACHHLCNILFVSMLILQYHFKRTILHFKIFIVFSISNQL